MSFFQEYIRGGYIVGDPEKIEKLSAAMTKIGASMPQAFSIWSEHNRPRNPWNIDQLFLAGAVDGYAFFGVKTQEGVFVAAGCRWFNLELAKRHWEASLRGARKAAMVIAISDWANQFKGANPPAAVVVKSPPTPDENYGVPSL